MTETTDLTIEREILIEAPIDVVWRTVTEAEQIERWFADRVQLDLRPGGEGSFAFRQGATSKGVTAALRVEAVEAPCRFAFRWGHPEGASPSDKNSVLVEFLLTDEGEDRTRLRVVETGLDLVSWSLEEKAQYAEDHRRGWSVHVGRLGELLGRAEV